VYIDSVGKLASYITTQEKSNSPCWLSIHLFNALGKISYMDRLYFDFDCKGNLKKAWKEAKRLRETLWDQSLLFSDHIYKLSGKWIVVFLVQDPE